MSKKLILASASPRRKDLLKSLGLNFEIDFALVDEEVEDGLLPKEIVMTLAKKKALAISYKYQEGLIIGADTLVFLNGEVLGKPKSEEDAFLMLKNLQGKEHEVYSGVFLIDVATGESEVSFEKTKVFFRPLSDNEIWSYIATKEPFDKAGAYAIQGLGSTIVYKIEGDYFNVVGLPLACLSKMLKKFGIQVI